MEAESNTAATIAVLSGCRYRAASLAISLSAQPGLRAVAVKDHDPEALAAFDTILVDLDRGMDNGLHLARTVTALRPEAHVVLLGLAESEENVRNLAVAGATGYVTSNASLETLVSVVRSVQKGEFACPPHITYALFSHLAKLAESSATGKLKTVVLTLRERHVANLLSRGLNNKEIAQQLCVSQHTVKNHVHRILRKLGIRNRHFIPRSLCSPLSVDLTDRHLSA